MEAVGSSPRRFRFCGQSYHFCRVTVKQAVTKVASIIQRLVPKQRYFANFTTCPFAAYSNIVQRGHLIFRLPIKRLLREAQLALFVQPS